MVQNLQHNTKYFDKDSQSFRSCTDIFDENVYLAIIDNEKVLMFNWKT